MWQLARETLGVCLFWGQTPVLQDQREGLESGLGQAQHTGDWQCV